MKPGGSNRFPWINCNPNYLAMLSLIESATEVLREQKEVRISRLFLWYLGDFGGYRGIRRLLQEKIGLDTRGLRLRPAHYDWTERLDNFVERGD
jgi:hypothetical protein